MDIDTVSNMLSISFPFADEGWVCGRYYLYHFTDGNWTNADQSYVHGSNTSIYFIPGTTCGWCVGSHSNILHTTDGMNWVKQTSPDFNHQDDYGLYGVYFQDTSTGWAVGAGGVILHTTDGGENWSIQESGTTNGLTSVFAVSSTVYAAGQNGTVLKLQQ